MQVSEQDRARMWQRVSTGNQDEASQLPDMIKWCDSHSYHYNLSESYTVKASAYHGRQIAKLEQAVADMEAGEYDVLVFWAADRMWRSDQAPAAFALVARIVATGGRLEFVEDEDLNRNPKDDAWRWYEDFSRTMGRAYKESKRKAARIRIKHDALRSAGSVVGRAPWGYHIMCRDFPECSVPKCGHIKVLVPTEVGKRYIPAIFQMAIDGNSLRSIAAWLDSERVKSPAGNNRWNEAFIGNRLIKNPTYYGVRPNAGALETPALVSATTWQQANAAVSSRMRPGRSTVKQDKTLVKPLCGACFGQVRDGCPSGKSPMYRIHSAYGSAGAGDYFRCTGHGPQRKGCGAPMLPVAEVEAAIIRTMMILAVPHWERTFVPGDDTADQIAKLREAGATAMKAGDYSAATDAMTKAAQLESQPRTAPHWESRPTDQTEAVYFASLDRDGQRDYLATQEITAKWHNENGGGIMVNGHPADGVRFWL